MILNPSPFWWIGVRRPWGPKATKYAVEHYCERCEDKRQRNALTGLLLVTAQELPVALLEVLELLGDRCLLVWREQGPLGLYVGERDGGDGTF